MKRNLRQWTTATLLLAVLAMGCDKGAKLRTDEVNRFHSAPDEQAQIPDAGWVGENYDYTGMGHLAAPEGRRVSAFDEIAGMGTVYLTSKPSRRFSGQQMFFRDPEGEISPIPIPRSLRNSVDRLTLISVKPPRVLLSETWVNQPGWQHYYFSVWGRDAGYQADLTVTDFSGNIHHRFQKAHDALVSPDRASVVFWRSSLSGLHNLFVADLESDEAPRFICAAMEMDPGSGRSFEAAWSHDSRYIKIEGRAYRRNIKWVYDTRSQKLFELWADPDRAW